MGTRHLTALGAGTLLAACAAPGPGPAPAHAARFDHVLICCDDAGLADWISRFLTPAGALASDHRGQGTRGEYVLLLNGFIELLYLADAGEARANEDAFGSDYAARWSGGVPFGIGLALPAPDASLPFPVHRYVAPGGSWYLMDAGNGRPGAPLIYASPPDRAHPRRESVDEVDSIEDPGIREAVRAYLTHPSGVLTLTRVSLTLPSEALEREGTGFLAALPEVELVAGDRPALTLEFDSGAAGETRRFPGEPSVTLRW